MMDPEDVHTAIEQMEYQLEELASKVAEMTRCQRELEQRLSQMNNQVMKWMAEQDKQKKRGW